MTAIFHGRPQARRIALVAWQQFLGALASMPLLSLGTAAIFVALALGHQIAAHKLDYTYSFLDGMETPSEAWFYAGAVLAQLVLALPLALAVCRFVLRGDTGAGLASREGAAFSLWAIVLGVICLGLIYLQGMLIGTPSLVALNAVLWVIAVILPLCCVPVFPDIVAEAPAARLSGRLENSLQVWSGSVLLFARACILALGPIVLLCYIVSQGISVRGGQPMLTRLYASQPWLVVTAVLTPLLIALVAALVASFYAAVRASRPDQAAAVA